MLTVRCKCLCTILLSRAIRLLTRSLDRTDDSRDRFKAPFRNSFITLPSLWFVSLLSLFFPSFSLTLFSLQTPEFKSRDEIKAILEKKQSESKPAAAAKPKQRTLEEEKEAGLGDFDEVSESEDEEPRQKKQKTK